MLDPGDTPAENLNFLLFCGAVISGVHEYGPLLRAAIASAGNDHRLGANEAPPAIMSVYLGTEIEAIFELIKEGKLDNTSESGIMNLGLSQIMPFVKDSGDRNRTSPFAFTGNRFEFRAVGAQQSVAGPLVVMNTILADSLNWIAEKLEAELSNGTEKPAAVISVLKELMQKHSKVIFGGDGYSEDWHKMAVMERGLKNLPTTAHALPFLKTEKIISLFDRTGVLTEVELKSRYEVYSEIYLMSIDVEAKLVIEMVKTMIYPAAMSYLNQLNLTLTKSSDLGMNLYDNTAKIICEEINAMMSTTDKLCDAILKEDFETTEEHMLYYAREILGLMSEIRTHADRLECEVADDIWPLPKYMEMLYIK